ncbi:MAG: hypothetical protein Q4C54_07525 [Clostridia bacterium]|nr:hypothetical protein [Clostridia bacterium]
MAITAYCKKCKADVAPGDSCPQCGGRLTKASRRVAWSMWHTPLRDWMSWNASMRIILPAYMVVVLVMLLAEYLAGGLPALDAMLQGPTMVILGALLAVVLLAAGVILYLQGHDLTDCVVDSKGVHITRYLPDPTPFRLMLRCCPASAMEEMYEMDGTPYAVISRKEVAWSELERVQLWPEKNLVLLYAPRWWMRGTIACTPYTYDDVLEYMRDKVGRKKNLLLPP